MTTDAAILNALRAAKSGSVSGADLAEQLGISRAAVWAHIKELRDLGYDIQASPHQGYHLRSTPDLLHADDLLSRLGKTRVVGRDIRVFKETASTNDLADKLGHDGAPEGVAIFAEAQTRGRGRLGRKWISPPGKGLWFSVLLRPRLPPSSVTQLTIAAATALVRGIHSQAKVWPEIKWPNDILMGGKKVAGVLTEMSAELDSVKYLILGIGLDVKMSAAEFPPELRKLASSVEAETGVTVDRPELAAAILRELDRDYARIIRGEFEPVAHEWEHHCSTLGHNVVIQMGGRRIQGRAESLDSDGALLLRTQHGHLERIVGGDVTLEK